MGRLVFWIIVLLVVAACSTTKTAIKVEQSSNETSEPDSIEYALETFDAKFESWYQMQKSPARYRSQSYYEYWNRLYVSEWNYKSSRGYRNAFFEPIIGYNPHEDYGFELNHELFHYFQYVEKVLGIQILTAGPKAGIL